MSKRKSESVPKKKAKRADEKPKLVGKSYWKVSFDDELITLEAPCYDRRPKSLKEGNFRGKSKEKMQIELNIYKYREMSVHPQSESNTAFFNV